MWLIIIIIKGHTPKSIMPHARVPYIYNMSSLISIKGRGNLHGGPVQVYVWQADKLGITAPRVYMYNTHQPE